MDIREKAFPNLKQSDRIFKDILSPLTDRGVRPYRYFYRVLGCSTDSTYFEDIARLDEELRKIGNYLLFDQEIRIPNNAVLTERVHKLLSQAPLKDFQNGAILNALESQGFLSLTNIPKINQIIKDALGVILNLYRANEPTTNLSMVVNFTIKILLWLTKYGVQLNKSSLYNPKIVYWGSPKVHEIYFLILMSLAGSDVLVFNTTFNDRFANVDKYNSFSMVIKKEKERLIGTFPAKPSLVNPQSQMNDHIIVTKLKKADQVFQELLIPLTKRVGYIGGEYPIVPAYFVRYIGVPDTVDAWEADYYNRLYNLEQTLQTRGSYLKFTEGVPVPNGTESSFVSLKINPSLCKDKNELLKHFLQQNLLPSMHNELLDNTVKKVFVDIVNLFAESSKANPTVTLNFSIKLVTWFNRYLSELFAIDDRNNRFSEFALEHNPKILFYGVIKPHEIYLVYALHKLGCDVLYVNSEHEGDRPFQLFDADETRTQLNLYIHTIPLAPFPLNERIVRKSTVAYNASKEIEDVIYGEDVGLFKPWQFANYTTQPVTLKTTYDELKILWKEPAKLRSEFKVQNKKVYIPNFFAKVNGVNEEINAYWQDLKTLTLAPNTKFIKSSPITRINYTKQDLFRADFLLDQQGCFDEQKVMAFQYYKFKYLKTDLQYFMIGKINELLGSDLFVNEIDETLKLKILMTVLTMDDDLVRLIEIFDYPQGIPKLVIYDNKRESFSEEDSILLAYFNLIGLDIVVFTPTNYRTLEQYLNPNRFDAFQLPHVQYDLALPTLSGIVGDLNLKNGFLSKLFNRSH